MTGVAEMLYGASLELELELELGLGLVLALELELGLRRPSTASTAPAL